MGIQEAMTEEKECFSCGICIGPKYEEHYPYPVGDKILCGWCLGKLKKQGYIQLNRDTRLLPDGTTIRFIQRLDTK